MVTQGTQTGPYLLAIDAGTGSCRALLFTEKGEQVAVSQREWTHHEPPGVPGGQDFDVETNWRLITACIRDALASAGAAGGDVAAVAATSMREGIVLYDARGAEIWACPNVDSRASAEAEDLIREGNAERIFEEAGDWVSITSPARLRWIARHRPGLFVGARGLGMLSDWIVYRLARVQVTEPSCGSSSGMFSLARRTWSARIAEICGIEAAVLPEAVDPGTVVGAVTAEAAAARARGLDPYVVMEEGAAQIPPGSNGLYAILSNLMNARRWVHASPSFVGFNLGDPAGRGRGTCVRAIEEAAAYVVRGHLGIIAELTGARVSELTFSGGGAKGRLWPQVIADVLGLPVQVPAVTESSALGAALCAGRGAGVYSSLTELEPTLRQRAATFEPRPEAVAVYDDRYDRWRQIYPRMLELSEDGLVNPLWRAAGSGVAD